VTKLGARCALTISKLFLTAASASNGITYWYWRKPPGPYTRFQFLIPSSGWKNWLIVCSSCSRCCGALAYQAALARRIE